MRGCQAGPCIAVTMNDRLDHFGSVVNMAARLERLSSGENVIMLGVVLGGPAHKRHRLKDSLTQRLHTL